MNTGTIKTETDEGFGFISRENEKNDLVDVTFDELQIGVTVTFDIAQGDKGPRAENVKLAE